LNQKYVHTCKLLSNIKNIQYLCYAAPRSIIQSYHNCLISVPRSITQHEMPTKNAVPPFYVPIQSQYSYFLLVHYISPPSTTFPTPATSVLTPFRLSSSNSLTTPCTIILRTLASAFVKASATKGPHSFGLATKPISLV
jgi:hypothetical protein